MVQYTTNPTFAKLRVQTSCLNLKFKEYCIEPQRPDDSAVGQTSLYRQDMLMLLYINHLIWRFIPADVETFSTYMVHILDVHKSQTKMYALVHR